VLKTKKKLFTQSSVSIDVFENLRVPENLLDLRSMLVNDKQSNVVFDFGPSEFAAIFKIDQKSGNQSLALFKKNCPLEPTLKLMHSQLQHICTCNYVHTL
jgi:hypothetical protein